jgi:hypothetical protein
MSAESPLTDVRHLHREPDADAADAEAVEIDEAAGAWPEEVDISYYADSAMTIPGMGDRGTNCGDWYPAEFCEECGTVHAGASMCQQRGCPDCWDTWTGNRAEAIVRRLTALRWAREDGLGRRTIHAVASPPQAAVVSLADVRRYRRQAQEHLRAAGLEGGVMVFHGFRATEETKEAYEAAQEANEEIQERMNASGGLWEFIRESDPEWRDLVYWSPHYHVIGLAPEFEPDEADAEGWVLERLSTAARLEAIDDRQAYASVAKMTRYILSHATFEPDGMRAVSWFGAAHATQFDPEAELSKRSVETIEKIASEIVGKGTAAEGAEDEERACQEEDCDGALREIWDANLFLGDREWVDRVGREAERRLSTAFEWAIGEVHPPPGMRGPRSPDEFDEAFDELLDC